VSPGRIATALSQWFATHGRDLPWRHTHDPYAIWLSEVIMQQTRIVQGTAYWERFMSTYPTVADLAAASEDEVLRLWQGLGYYSRARNLHKAARQIVALGSFPRTADDLRRLKGVGDYTAAAIASFAYNEPAAAVDGNWQRVLSRVQGLDTPINSNEGKKLFQALADDIIAATEVPSSVINGAMMDLGATVCTPKGAQCNNCPLMEECEAYRQGMIDTLPVKLKTVKITTRHLIYIYLRHHDMTAIRRRGEGDIWQGLWEPVLLEGQKLADTPYAAAQPIALNVKHVLTHRILLADFYLLCCDTPPVLPEGYIWVRESELDQYAVPRLIEKMIGELGIRSEE
jgi:A/G-specific adenine glycosylase